MDVREEKPAELDMFEWCAEMYFKHLWDGQLAEKDLPDEIQEYFRNEPYRILVEHAVNMTHSTVKETVNSGSMPTAEEMKHIGRVPASWADVCTGGGYRGLAESVTDS